MRVSARDKGAMARMAPYTSHLKASQACALVVVVTLLAPPLVHFGDRSPARFLTPILTEFVPFGHAFQSPHPIRLQLSSERLSAKPISWNVAHAALTIFQLESHRFFDFLITTRCNCDQLALPSLRAPPQVRLLF